MPIYIDAEKFLKSAISKFKCVPLIGVTKCRNGEECFDGEDLEQVLNQAPTEDVVPRSEVEELTKENESLAKTVNEASKLIRKLRSENNRLKIYDEKRDIRLHQRLVREAKQEVAKKIFEVINDIVESCRIFKRNRRCYSQIL